MHFRLPEVVDPKRSSCGKHIRYRQTQNGVSCGKGVLDKKQSLWVVSQCFRPAAGIYRSEDCKLQVDETARGLVE